jgi:hypothetical protein
MDYKSVYYTKLDENNEPIEGLITAQNMFYVMGSSWDFDLEDCLAAGFAPVLDSDRDYLNGDGAVEVEMGELERNDDGSYTQLWNVATIPVSEKRARFMERTRLNLLSQSDWTQVVDSPLSDELKAEYATYRQTLRDLPSTINWDTIESDSEITWPRQPGITEPAADADPTTPLHPETGEPL